MLLLSLASWAQAAPDKAPHYPVIEVRASNQILRPPVGPSTLELPPIQGEKLPPRQTVRSTPFWLAPYEMPAGPGRAWPNAAPPGSWGPAGGLFSPYP